MSVLCVSVFVLRKIKTDFQRISISKSISFAIQVCLPMALKAWPDRSRETPIDHLFDYIIEHDIWFYFLMHLKWTIVERVIAWFRWDLVKCVIRISPPLWSAAHILFATHLATWTYTMCTSTNTSKRLHRTHIKCVALNGRAVRNTKLKEHNNNNSSDDIGTDEKMGSDYKMPGSFIYLINYLLSATWNACSA